MQLRDQPTIVQIKNRVLIGFYKSKARISLGNFLRTKGNIQIETVFPADTHNMSSISMPKIGLLLDRDCNKVLIFQI